jgi:predicted GNAT family N-acyltransferase
LSADCRLTLTVRPARDAAEVAAALDLRVRVFCDEQGVDREAEIDGLDREATQIVALDQSDVVATCRLRFVDGACKLERMAVERRLRGSGVGTRLLSEAESEAARLGAGTMVVHAQRRAEDFYADAGYRPEGSTFAEEGIEHVRMTKSLAGDWSEPG